MTRKLTMTLPAEVATALRRRHEGREDIEAHEASNAWAQMQVLWAKYQRKRAALEYCEGEWWDKMEVEKHFMRSRWYYAHRKRKKLMKEVKDLHASMFYLLVGTDGNYEPFGSDAMYAQDIYEDFKSKYAHIV